MIAIKAVVIAACAVQTAYALPTNASLPVVDLDYALHRATINETGQYYNFSNIRYAAPPIGNLRFAAPIEPTEVNRTINDGQQGAICAQGTPYWEEVALYYFQGANTATLEFVEAEVEAVEKNLTISGLSAPAPLTSEDCLFLDVIVPKSIYDSCGESSAPVVVWIYGGGYVAGSKFGSGNPATLISRSQENGDEGVIYVALNYRLGLFGWLSGPTFEESGAANAALLDQRLALEWIQKYIYLFGGDADRVTVIGESAGAGSIMHQITAYGGHSTKSWLSPVYSDAQQEATFQNVITQAQELIGPNITSVSDLRNLDFATLAGLNTIITARSAPYGTFTFGPAVDGTFVPELPAKLLLEGKFDTNVKIMTGHNSNEGAFFTSPFFSTDADIATDLTTTLPTISNSTLAYVTGTLYPPVYNGSYPYTSIWERASLITAEIVFTCNTRYLNTAFLNETHSYYFTVPPGLHGEDIAYTFFNGDTTTSNDGLPVNATIAADLQRYIMNFAMTGNPNGVGVPFFPEYQSNATTLVLGTTGLGSVQTDTTANNRCAWWQQALYE
ncbi:putative carboxylesterase family protein [Botrytis fragariae]|uniref:Carboxylic ester hydrolase n=1 Tax=Botrytis fragariae TaxID=1964551 RepID=A0A8H6ELJ2_9HELO|nr:putative carboxylesterase family protein [Botrytis fragariae]KAF5876692.1 putative carboxylesterase family protein [Botrytis fragariae]